VEVADRIGVERAPMALERLPDRCRMRRQQGRTEMHTVSAKAELRANAVPGQRGTRLGLGPGRERLRPEHSSGREREPASCEEVSAV
jgi:hypothetical protein